MSMSTADQETSSAEQPEPDGPRHSAASTRPSGTSTSPTPRRRLERLALAVPHRISSLEQLARTFRFRSDGRFAKDPSRLPHGHHSLLPVADRPAGLFRRDPAPDRR